VTPFNRNPFLLIEANVHQDELLDVVVLDDAEIIRTKPQTVRPKSKYDLLSVHSKPWSTWSAALLVTVVVHLLLVGSLTLGTGKRASRPPEKEGFQSVDRNAGGTEVVSVLIFVPDKSIHLAEEANESAYTPNEDSQQETQNSMAIASNVGGMEGSPPTLEQFDASDSIAKEADGDGGEAALLFGRYMGQIKARIERAWNYPAASSRRAFQCKAQIKQSKNGDVEEIVLQRCDMDTQWQASLVKAIQEASPLSAPPNEKVFTDVVTLNFTAQTQIANATDSTAQLSAARHAQLNY
jgi:hypothetical protein